MAFSTLDLVLIGLYIVGIIIYGLNVGKKGDSEAYFLGGKSMSWPVIGLSMFAANISSNSLVAITGGAYSHGISVFNYEWMAAVVLVIFCLFILPFYIKSGIYTMPEYFGRRFDQRSRVYFSLITLIGNLFIDTAGTLYAGYATISFVVGDVNPYWVTGGLALFAASYTVTGGLAAVMKTEVVNTLILLFSACMLALIIWMQAGDWSSVMQIAESKGSSMMHLVLPASDKSMPWTGLVLGVPLLGFYFWCNNQFIVQRSLSAKSIDEGRKGALFAGLLKIPVMFLLVLPGIMALKLLPNLQNSSEAYPRMMFQYLPSGLLGLTVAGFLAAMASAVSATLNSASTLVSMDLVRQWKPELSSTALVKVGQITTLVFMVIAAVWAPQIAKATSFMDYMQGVLALISPPVVAVFLAGLFSRRTTAGGAFAGLSVGLVLGIAFALAGVLGWESLANIPFLLKAPLLFVICLAVAIIVSRTQAAPSAESLDGLVWERSFFEEETKQMRGLAWHQNYRILSIILLAITFIIVWWYR
jgi:SSS family solute:Na+ symporter